MNHTSGLCKPGVLRPVTPPGTNANASGDTSLFLGFVKLLASKPPQDQQMLVQIAIAEANGTSGVVFSDSVNFANRSLRRSSSTAEVRGTNGYASMNSRLPATRVNSRMGKGNPISFYDVGSWERWGTNVTNSMCLLPTQSYSKTLPMSYSSLPRASPQVVRDKMQAQLRRRWAALILQSHWRGWQHRRLARFLRARRVRHRRLDYLWHLEHTRWLLIAQHATVVIQRRWRGDRARRSLAERPCICSEGTDEKPLDDKRFFLPVTSDNSPMRPDDLHGTPTPLHDAHLKRLEIIVPLVSGPPCGAVLQSPVGQPISRFSLLDACTHRDGSSARKATIEWKADLVEVRTYQIERW